MENGQKLDNIQDTVTEVRVSMATMTGKLDAVLSRLDGHDAIGQDVERRIRTLERRNYAVPTLNSVMAVVSLAVALWVAFNR